jgi:hypothetical protein
MIRLVMVPQLVEESAEEAAALEAPASISNGNGNGYSLEPLIASNDFTNSNGSGSSLPPAGTLRVTVVGARDLFEEAKTYVSCVVGEQSHRTGHSGKTVCSFPFPSPLTPIQLCLVVFRLSILIFRRSLLLQDTPEWEESNEFNLAGDQILVVSLFEHHTFGRSKLIGSSEVQVCLSFLLLYTIETVPVFDHPLFGPIRSSTPSLSQPLKPMSKSLFVPPPDALLHSLDPQLDLHSLSYPAPRRPHHQAPSLLSTSRISPCYLHKPTPL